MMTRAGDGQHFPALRHVEGGEIGDGFEAEGVQLFSRRAADAPDLAERDGRIKMPGSVGRAQVADAAELRPLLGEEIGQLRFRLLVADAEAGRDLRFPQTSATVFASTSTSQTFTRTLRP